MDKPKLREQKGSVARQAEEGLASAPKVVLSYLAQRNQRATSQTRSPSHPSRVSQDQHPVDLHATWRTGGVASDRGPVYLKTDESEYVKFVEELLDRALKKDSENRGLNKKLQEMEVKLQGLSTQLADLAKEVTKDRQGATEKRFHHSEIPARVPLPSLSDELRVTPVNQLRTSSEHRGTPLTAIQYKDERLKKVEQRVAKVEKLIEEQASGIKDDCMQELMVYTNNYLSSKTTAGGTKVFKKDELASERLIENMPTLNSCLAACREEFNMKLQLLMEELQRTVTLHDLDHRLTEVSRVISKSSLEHLNKVEKRISPLEEGFLFLRSAVERILKMFESKVTEIEPQVQNSRSGLGFTGKSPHHPMLGSEYENLNENQRQSVDELCDPSLLNTTNHKVKPHSNPSGNSLFKSNEILSPNDAKPSAINKKSQPKGEQTIPRAYFDPHRFPAQLAGLNLQSRDNPSHASIQNPANPKANEERVYFPNFDSGNPPYVLVDSSDCAPGYPIRMMLPRTLISERGHTQQQTESANRSQQEASPNHTLLSSQYRLKPPKSRQTSASPQPSSTERLVHAPNKLAEAETEASWNRVNRSQSASHQTKAINNPQTQGIARRAGHSIVDSATTVLAATAPLHTLQQLLGRQPSSKKAARSTSSKSAKKQRKKDKIRSLLGQKAPGSKHAT